MKTIKIDNITIECTPSEDNRYSCHVIEHDVYFGVKIYDEEFIIAKARAMVNIMIEFEKEFEKETIEKINSDKDKYIVKLENAIKEAVNALESIEKTVLTNESVFDDLCDVKVLAEKTLEKIKKLIKE